MYVIHCLDRSSLVIILTVATIAVVVVVVIDYILNTACVYSYDTI